MTKSIPESHPCYRIWLLSAVSLLSLCCTLPETARAGEWSPLPHPPEIVNGIWVEPYIIQPTQTLVVPEGSTLSLNAMSSDFDQLKIGSATQLQPDNATSVIWSVSNQDATLSNGRVASGTLVTVEVPDVPTGEDSLTFTVTAKPDDDSQANPGGPLGGHTGNRNDAPGTGVSVAIKVIKNCPTTAAISQTCTPSETEYNNILLNPLSPKKTWGAVLTKTSISGGTAPTPPGNWNGLVLKEAVEVHPVNSGTMTAADLENGATKAAMCTGGGHFIIGSTLAGVTGNTLYGCTLGPANNAIWDNHGADSNMTQRKAGTGAKTVICRQHYLCPNGSKLTPNFKITRSFENKFVPSGFTTIRKNKVTITKAAE